MKQDVYIAIEKMPDDGALFQHCQKLTMENKAILDDMHFARAKSGFRSQTESVFTLISPCEAEPPTLPNSVGANGFVSKPKRDFILPIDMSYIPSSFEPRDVGMTLELESTDSGDGKIDIRLHTSHVEYPGDQTFFSYTNLRAHKWEIKLPKFYVQKQSRSVTVQAKKPCLVGLTNPRTASGTRNPSEVILHFIIADFAN